MNNNTPVVANCSRQAPSFRFVTWSFHAADGRILQAHSKLQQLGHLRHIDIFQSHLPAAELGIDVLEVDMLKQRIDEVRIDAQSGVCELLRADLQNPCTTWIALVDCSSELYQCHVKSWLEGLKDWTDVSFSMLAKCDTYLLYELYCCQLSLTQQCCRVIQGSYCVTW